MEGHDESNLQLRAWVQTSCIQCLAWSLLETAKAKVDCLLNVWRAEGKRTTGFVLTSDGWEDVSGRPLINILLSTPKGAHFVEAVDTSGDKITLYAKTMPDRPEALIMSQCVLCASAVRLQKRRRVYIRAVDRAY